MLSVTTQGKILIKTYLINLKSTVIRNEDCGIEKRHTARGLTACKNPKILTMLRILRYLAPQQINFQGTNFKSLPNAQYLGMLKPVLNDKNV